MEGGSLLSEGGSLLSEGGRYFRRGSLLSEGVRYFRNLTVKVLTIRAHTVRLVERLIVLNPAVTVHFTGTSGIRH